MLYYVVNGANIIILAFTFLLGHGDVELNPRPKILKPFYIFIGH